MSAEPAADWLRLPISEIADFRSGDPIKIAQLSERSGVCPVPVFGGNGIAGYTSSATASMPTVILGRVGQKCGVVYRNTGPVWITDNALYAHRFKRPVDVQFLAFALEGAHLNDVKNHNDLPLITQSILRDVKIAWPEPVEEQRRVAEALSDIDEMIAALKRVIAKKQAIKQGMMQQLLAGKTRLPGFTSDWIPQRMESVLDKLQAGVSVNSVSAPGPYSILRTSCVSRGEFDPSERKTVAPSDVKRIKVSPCADSLIISRMNTPALVGEVGYVDADWPTLFLPDRLWLATKRRMALVNMRWLGYLLSSAQYREQLREIATGTSGSMKNIARTAFLQLSVPFPLIEEQTAIAGTLAYLDRDLANHRARIDKANNIKQGMMQQLLAGRTRLPG